MTLDRIVTLAGLAVPAASAIASAVNHVVRARMDAQPPKHVPTWLAATSAALNAFALNADKSIQMFKVMRGGQ